MDNKFFIYSGTKGWHESVFSRFLHMLCDAKLVRKPWETIQEHVLSCDPSVYFLYDASEQILAPSVECKCTGGIYLGKNMFTQCQVGEAKDNLNCFQIFSTALRILFYMLENIINMQIKDMMLIISLKGLKSVRVWQTHCLGLYNWKRPWVTPSKASGQQERLGWHFALHTSLLWDTDCNTIVRRDVTMSSTLRKWKWFHEYLHSLQTTRLYDNSTHTLSLVSVTNLQTREICQSGDLALKFSTVCILCPLSVIIFPSVSVPEDGVGK